MSHKIVHKEVDLIRMMPHFHYEVKMLYMLTSKLLEHYNELYPMERFVKSAVHESFGFHWRVLIDFLFGVRDERLKKKKGYIKMRDTDVIARDYIPSWLVELPSEDGVNAKRDLVNAQVAHLCIGRHEPGSSESEWEILEWIQPIENRLNKFYADTPKNLRHQDWIDMPFEKIKQDLVITRTRVVEYKKNKSVRWLGEDASFPVGTKVGFPDIIARSTSNVPN